MIILDAKTDFSFLRGFGTPEQWLQRCKATGVNVLGVADYCSTWGHTQFQPVFEGSGVRLLYGVQIPVCVAIDKSPAHSLVTLIAKSRVQELYNAMTMAYQQTYYRPRITWRQVMDLKDCVVIVNRLAPFHKPIAAKLEGAYTSGPECGLPRVFAYAPSFPSHEDREAFEVCRKIGSRNFSGSDDPDIMPLMRMGEAKAWLKITDAELQNAQIIADQCTATIPKAALPVPIKTLSLREMALAGAVARGLHPLPDAYIERLDRELSVIKEKNFEDYFHIVAGIVAWARDRFFVGPGRGSSGGSLVCYLLGITTLDPLKFGTLFERFIDITRPDLPDIDIDFPDDKRDEVLAFIKGQYDHSARLGTITFFGGKSALNDAAKATGVPLDVAREIGRYTEGHTQGSVISPAKVFETVPEAQRLLARFPAIGIAGKIDGHARHAGIHPAGVVLAKESISNYGAVNKDGVLCADMHGAEAHGLIKVDVLGLRNLSIINECCELAGIDRNSLYDLDWEDREVYERIFNTGRVTGIFQFEGQSVRGLLRQTKVSCFEDLCAVTSLARPGPLMGGAANAWIRARNGETSPRDIHPSLTATLGVICYQEQAMAIVRDLGAFSGPEVNGFRRAVGKKDTAKLLGYRGKFLDGNLEHHLGPMKNWGDAERSMESVTYELAEKLWEEMCDFGSYAFNRSHAVAYCMVSFMTAWLKMKYPMEFALAQLRHTDDDSAKALLRDLTNDGMSFVPFDIDLSEVSWSVRDGVLYGGFDGVKGIGTKTAKALVALRQEAGPSWKDKLTDVQRTKLLSPSNTPWHTLSYFREKYSLIYNSPEDFRVAGANHGFRGPVLHIKDIPDRAGEYAFIGRIARKQTKDLNEPSRVEKRDGVKFDVDTHFFNLFIEDDTDEIPGTVNRYKAKDFPWLLENTDGKDYFFRGKIINEGRRWLFIEKILQIGKQDG